MRLTNVCHCDLQVDVHETAPHGASDMVPPALSVDEVGGPALEGACSWIMRSLARPCAAQRLETVCVLGLCASVCESGWGSRQRLCDLCRSQSRAGVVYSCTAVSCVCGSSTQYQDNGSPLRAPLIRTA